MAVDDISLEMLSPLGVSDGAVRLGPTLQQSRARAVGHANSGKIDIARDITNEVSSAAQDEAHQQPTGVRFVLLYLCILLGAFFIGYVRRPFVAIGSMNVELMAACRIQVAWRR